MDRLCSDKCTYKECAHILVKLCCVCELDCEINNWALSLPRSAGFISTICGWDIRCLFSGYGKGECPTPSQDRDFSTDNIPSPFHYYVSLGAGTLSFLMSLS